MRLNILVNIHTTEFLERQLRSIVTHALPTYKTTVIFSCPTEEIRDSVERQARRCTGLNTIMNPELIQKRRHHGSILHGICSNLRHAPSCDMTLVLSARSVLCETIDHEAVLDKLTQPIIRTRSHSFHHLSKHCMPQHWFDRFMRFEQFLPEAKGHIGGHHEGLMFDGRRTSMLKTYLQEHDISECFKAHVCAEEYT